MVLPKLPNEVKIHVFRHLQPINWASSHATDLANVVLSCRLFYELAIPILYSSFNGGGKARTFDFLQTVLNRPDLAKYVRRLVGLCPQDDRNEEYALQYGYGYTYNKRGRMHNLDAKLEGLEAALRTACTDHSLRRRWYRSLARKSSRNMPGNWDSITALLVVLLPNLSMLRLLSYCESIDDVEVVYMPYIFSRAVKLQNSGVYTPQSLSNLRKFEICVDEIYPSLKSIIPFLQLKSIRHAACFLSSTNEGGAQVENGNNIEEPISHITHLSFTDCCDIDSRSLANFLQVMRGLASVLYVHWNEIEEPYPFIPSEIRRGLLHSKDTLRELTLVNDTEDYAQADEYEGQNGESSHAPENISVSPIGSLLEFGQLRRLDVTAVALVGRDDAPPGTKRLDFEPLGHARISRVAGSLPESLEELTLRACFPPIYTVIDALFERKREGRLKQLKRIDLFFQKDVSDEEVFGSEEGNKCELKGIGMGIRVTRHLVEFLHE
ncbi:hypothetical protein NA56DRAFT_652003 [Hyaloscypha hepaticicola]|uniref:Uncharacterized protein n=1 Tax=Hyaloscypha hepaticicola TaxID=2082293 RepID=A0A2J6PGG0_9HELO|nr:hypothetical protein NA56DRAFT_652003 [Hyaloscypha hepaticicola]